MRHLCTLRWAASVVGLALVAATAEAGSVTSATGTIGINGTDVTVAAGKPVATKAGDRIESRTAKVTYKSDTGDELVLDEGTAAREDPTANGVAALFLTKGSVTGQVTDKTLVGVAAGWISASQGTKSKVYVEAAPGREATQALFRAVQGTANVRYRSFSVSLAPAHSVTLDIDTALQGSLCFRTGQQNTGDVDIRRTLPGGVIDASVPKATLGCFTDEAGNKTKICNDINSLKTAKIRIATHFVGKADNTAAIGPGTCALIDNATGAIEVLFAVVEFEIIERAISLTTEFATLTQSNFSDVK